MPKSAFLVEMNLFSTNRPTLERVLALCTENDYETITPVRMNRLSTLGTWLLAGSLLTACTKNVDLTPASTSGQIVNVNNPSQTFDPAGQTLLLQGSFTGAGSYMASGTVKVYEKSGQRTLVFENFNSSSGPDLRVYLAETTGAANFIELAKLTNTGNFYLSIPTTYDPAKQRNALIWCKQFSVLFGAAPLK
jgi:hypothetical protein